MSTNLHRVLASQASKTAEALENLLQQMNDLGDAATAVADLAQSNANGGAAAGGGGGTALTPDARKINHDQAWNVYIARVETFNLSQTVKEASEWAAVRAINFKAQRKDDRIYMLHAYPRIEVPSIPYLPNQPRHLANLDPPPFIEPTLAREPVYDFTKRGEFEPCEEEDFDEMIAYYNIAGTDRMSKEAKKDFVTIFLGMEP